MTYRSRRVVTSGLATLALSAGLASAYTAPALADNAPSWCTTSGDLRVEDLPSRLPAYAGCDLTGRVVRAGAVVLSIPAPGFGIGFDAFGAGAPSLTLSTLPDGTVEIGPADDGAPQDSTAPSLPNPLAVDPCASATATAYSKLGFKAYTSVNWYYNGAGAPASVASTAQSAINAAASNMADGKDDCGIIEVPRDSYHSYLGATTRTAQVTATTCPAPDAYNVISWGSLGSTTLASTCSSWTTEVTPWRRYTSDIKINTDFSWTTTTFGCVGTADVGSYNLEAILTHEWGHVFGLGHVAESGATSSQTMSTNSDGTCQRGEATLGRGDLNGMFSLYGAW